MMGLKNKLQGYLVRLFWLFPIKNNRVVFWDFKGKSFGGNSRAISDYMKKFHDVERVWIIEKKPEDVCGEKFYSPRTIRAAYNIATAKIWIETHNFFPDATPKRRKQIAIQTWHGAIPMKTIEGFESPYFSTRQIQAMKKSSEITDYLLTNGKLSSALNCKGMLYDGDVLEYGSPRCDLVFQHDKSKVNQIKERIKNRYNIPGEINRFVIYAPTYHDDDSILGERFDAQRVCRELEAKTRERWVCLFRLHPLSEKVSIDEYSVDVRDYGCVEELLMIADVCITDYSSIIFDFMFTYRMCLLFACDYEEYKKTRGFCLDYCYLPFPKAYSMDELVMAIREYDSQLEQEKIREFCHQNGIKEDGCASRRMGDFVYRLIHPSLEEEKE